MRIPKLRSSLYKAYSFKQDIDLNSKMRKNAVRLIIIRTL